MEKEFVPYDLAIKLKALGFDEPCFAYYIVNEVHAKGYAFCYFNIPKRLKDDWDVLAPTFSQAFRWFREKYSIYGMILPSYADKKEVKDRFFYELSNGKKLQQELEYHTTYEEAELACLTKLIEIVESKSE